ncbi:hypothetical protein [Actinopolymorpha sp. B9G3]|uniref:glycosyl hydrolase 2 galactose-binding domain-containing protein n=1 Tax=Actinopolymorpha sp. B9G3 TaxID=3158970 RepID=UPI0032D92053
MRNAVLTGPWEVAGRPVEVPGCWEDTGIAKDAPGPFDYRTTFDVGGLAASDRVWLRFGAVSYACEVFVDGQEVGRHIGMWDAFDVEVTSAVDAGGTHELLVRVEKPASLTAGPDSPAVPGRYPTRETLAGFLPYVWGHVHGGIWQDVEVVVTGPVVFGDVTAWGTPAGEVTIAAEVSGASTVKVTLTDPTGGVVSEVVRRVEHDAVFSIGVDDPQPWSPDDPRLYTVHIAAHTDDGSSDDDDSSDGDDSDEDGSSSDDGGRGRSDERTLRVGLRELAAHGSELRLNGDPLYPRMLLSWGLYPDLLHAAPSRDRVRADLERLRELGFNGVKLCLWFPPTYYFDIADELGLLVWVELPMWLPHPTEHFRTQLPAETDRLVRMARNHPSVILYTLGCELSAVIGDDVLAPLYAHVKGLVRDALVRDNSGSGEAYGGLLTEYADFYDHHLYCELQHFRETLEHFAPGWRDAKPWLFGEFCDLDTFRDLRRLGAVAADRPWWTHGDPAVNPQGARWQYDVQAHEERLRRNGFWDRGAELEAISRQQALLHRKVTLEAVRIRHDTSGYVVTGERDTPISTAGLWDDLGELKVDPAEFRAFNSDLVACVGWDRRRTWRAGGDRPAYGDPWCHEAGAVVRPHLVLAHHGRDSAPVWAEWTVALDGSDPFTSGSHGPGERLRPGTVREVCVAAFEVPDVRTPRQATLRVRAWVGGELTSNTWRFWFFPHSPWAEVGPVVLDDPGGRVADLRALAPAVADTLTTEAVTVATRWTPDLAHAVENGARAILLADEASDSPLPLVPMPFWREAVKVIEPHEAWDDFPHEGWTDLQFAGCAPDLAIDTSDTCGVAGPMRPLLRRIDARTAHLHDYATEIAWGKGRLIVSTLRFEGSRGDQPRGLARNTAASYLLSRFVSFLQMR